MSQHVRDLAEAGFETNPASDEPAEGAQGVPPLVARAQGGDDEAFRQLFVQHRQDVARLTFRLLGRRADLEDVIQDVFLQVHRSLRDFRGQSRFSTWLYRVTVNVVLMNRRAARSRPVFSDPPDAVANAPAEDTVLPDEQAARNQRVAAFSRLLERLSEKKRTVFVLHELHGVPPGEIARIVGAPVLTVRTRLFYARRELEQLLHEEPALAALGRALEREEEPDE